MVERIRTLLESRQLTPTQFADVIGVARPIVSHILSGRNKPSLEVVQRILAAMPDLAMPWLLNGTGPMLAGTSAAAILSVPSEATAIPVTPVAAAAPVSVEAAENRPIVMETAVEAPPAPVHGNEHIEQEPVRYDMPKAVPLRTSIPAPGRTRVMPKRFVANAAPMDALPQLPDSLQAPTQRLAVTSEQAPAAVPVQDTTPSPPIPTPTPTADVSDAAATLQLVPANETTGATLASALFAGGDKPIRRIVIFYRDGSFADYQPE
ncbi:helix-turn-helix domain-containing protein [Hymenobacter segetis]|uniref:Helix-turn-helix domain-containing protein n=2 Tax=Hymenobacter segetis TaxID=2025509 RepID=A0ABU9LS27_9BACT